MASKRQNKKTGAARQNAQTAAKEQPAAESSSAQELQPCMPSEQASPAPEAAKPEQVQTVANPEQAQTAPKKPRRRRTAKKPAQSEAEKPRPEQPEAEKPRPEQPEPEQPPKEGELPPPEAEKPRPEQPEAEKPAAEQPEPEQPPKEGELPPPEAEKPQPAQQPEPEQPLKEEKRAAPRWPKKTRSSPAQGSKPKKPEADEMPELPAPNAPEDLQAPDASDELALPEAPLALQAFLAPLELPDLPDGLAKPPAPPKKRKKKKKKRRHHWIFWTFVLLTLMIAGGSARYIYWLFTESDSTLFDVKEDVELPNLLGLRWEDVQTDETYSGFTLERVEVYHDEVPAGEIVDQNPRAPRHVKENSRIIVKVSKGIETVTVPDVTGWNRDTAREKLSEMNLTMLFRSENVPDVPADSVIRTDPEAGMLVKAGTTITVYIRRESQSLTCYRAYLHRRRVGSPGRHPPHAARPADAEGYCGGCRTGGHCNRPIAQSGRDGNARHACYPHNLSGPAATAATAATAARTGADRAGRTGCIGGFGAHRAFSGAHSGSCSRPGSRTGSSPGSRTGSSPGSRTEPGSNRTLIQIRTGIRIQPQNRLRLRHPRIRTSLQILCIPPIESRAQFSVLGNSEGIRIRQFSKNASREPPDPEAAAMEERGCSIIIS